MATGPMAGYAKGDSQHLVFRGADDHVHEFYFRRDGRGWLQNNLTDAANSGPLEWTSAAALRGYMHGGAQHVLALARRLPSGPLGVAELVKHPDQPWDLNWLNDAAGGPQATASSPLAEYRYRGDQHIVYTQRKADPRGYNAVAELWRGSGAWKFTDLHARATNAENTIGDSLTGYEWDGGQHVVGRRWPAVAEFYFENGGPWRYNENLLSGLPQAPPVASGREHLVGYSWGNAQHVVYRGDDDHIHELVFRRDGNGWQHQDLSTAAQGSPPPAGGPLAAYTFEDQQHIVYLGDDAHIHELVYERNAGWRHKDLTVEAGAPRASSSLVQLAAWTWGRTQHIAYFDDTGRLHELHHQRPAEDSSWLAKAWGAVKGGVSAIWQVVKAVVAAVVFVLDVLAFGVQLVFAIPLVGTALGYIARTWVEVARRLFHGIVELVTWGALRKKIRVRVAIRTSYDAGLAEYVPVAERFAVDAWLRFAQDTLDREANVGLRVVSIDEVYADTRAHDTKVPLDGSGQLLHDLWSNSNADLGLRGSARRLVGVSPTLTVFVVDNDPDKSGVSLGPLTDYVFVEAEPEICTLAHEVGHACGLWHVGGKDNLMRESCTPTDPTLGRDQRILLRTSRFCSLF
ncbi:MAG: hypothetical protein AAGA37_03570 [Actinomycetota bacterium]